MFPHLQQLLLSRKGSLAAKVAAILRKYGTDAHVYLPGIGTINGLTAGNCLESTGNTVSTVDGLVGLALDANATLGPELVINGDFSNGATNWSLGTGWGVADGVASRGVAASYSNLTATGWTVVVGKTYKVTIDVVALSGSTAVVLTGGVSSPTFSTPGIKRFYFTAVSTTPAIVQAANALTAITVDNISVQEVTGINATQPTTANKPFLRKGAVNRLLNSATLSTQNVTTVAAPYTLSFTGTGSIQLSGTNTTLLSGTGASDRVSATFTPTAGTLTLTVTGSVTSAQLELGSTASTYAPTTSAAASNGVGNYAWEFDGSNDSFALGSVPFQMADDHCVIAGVNSRADAARDALSITAASGTPLIKLGIAAGPILQYALRDDAGIVDLLSAGSITLGTNYVISGRKVGNVKVSRLNSVQQATASTALGTTTFTTANIGVRNTTVPANYWSGAIYPVIAIKGTVTDADLLILEKFVGSLSGVQI
jgi:hypothetical protein